MIYILSLYGEDGAESVKATADPEKVIDMLKSYRMDIVNHHLSDRTYEVTDEEIESLQKLLRENKPIDGQDLVRGWGGFMLHIVEDYDGTYRARWQRHREGDKPDFQRVGENAERLDYRNLNIDEPPPKP